MSEHLTISATEFKAKCLDIFTQLADRRLTGVTITKRGQPVAEVGPPSSPPGDVLAGYGSMRGMARWASDDDLMAPAFEGEIDAEHGILHN